MRKDKNWMRSLAVFGSVDKMSFLSLCKSSEKEVLGYGFLILWYCMNNTHEIQKMEALLEWPRLWNVIWKFSPFSPYVFIFFPHHVKKKKSNLSSNAYLLESYWICFLFSHSLIVLFLRIFLLRQRPFTFYCINKPEQACHIFCDVKYYILVSSW